MASAPIDRHCMSLVERIIDLRYAVNMLWIHLVYISLPLVPLRRLF